MRASNTVVRTLDPQDAHPVYLAWMTARANLLQLAATMSRAGQRDAAVALRDIVDSRLATDDCPAPRQLDGGAD